MIDGLLRLPDGARVIETYAPNGADRRYKPRVCVLYVLGEPDRLYVGYVELPRAAWRWPVEGWRAA